MTIMSPSITIGFTGTATTSLLSDEVLRDRVDPVLVGLLNKYPALAYRFVTGAAVGIDSYVCRRLLEIYPPSHPVRTLGHPSFEHVAVWPKDQRTIHLVDHDLRNLSGLKIHEMWDGSTNGDRNHTIIALSDVLEAFPTTPNERLRSGTWQTVRFGRAKPIPVTLNPLRDAA